VATPVARNVNEALVAPMVGLAESAFDGILKSGGRFCVGAFVRNLALVAVKMFSHLINFIETFINVLLSMRFEKIMLQ
jgi:hypothetical protein